MKHDIIITIFLFMSLQLSATSYYQSLSSRISNWGYSIEKVENVPMIGKLTNLLPIAALAASLRSCPLQTMMVCFALTVYCMSRSESVQKMMKKYEIIPSVVNKKYFHEEDIEIDEDIFIFDDSNEEDNKIVESTMRNSGDHNKLAKSEKYSENKIEQDHPTFL